MMTLDMIDRLKQTVDERWESPVADLVAAAWGHPAGTAKWWRSSATHVFVLPDQEGKRYLRFAPDDRADAFAAVAALAARLADTGARVARPVPTTAGTLVATVATPLGFMQAMMVEAAPGEAFDAEELDEPGARAWGRALAEFHLAAADAKEPLPGPFATPPTFPDDPELAACAAALTAAARKLSREPARFGVVHGDFELDNLAWQDGTATAFDLDEAHRSWYAADIAFAVRDLCDHSGRPAPEHAERFAAFIDGYREARPLTADEIDMLPLFAGLHALTALGDIAAALGEPDAAEAAWKADLRAHLTALAADHRTLALDTARPHRTLEDLEGDDWGDSPAGATTLVSKVHALRRVPLGSLTVEHLRMLIGQRVGLDHLLPIALKVLRADPLAAGDMSPGALLRSALHAVSGDSEFALELRALAAGVDDPEGLLRDELDGV
ncbi:contact-dependent growth inhibition system immunity protein [Glycomyces paridis]|nr:contact-dependent growth inhibition system immunity protein [Glycomyces paridis]